MDACAGCEPQSSDWGRGSVRHICWSSGAHQGCASLDRGRPLPRNQPVNCEYQVLSALASARGQASNTLYIRMLPTTVVSVPRTPLLRDPLSFSNAHPLVVLVVKPRPAATAGAVCRAASSADSRSQAVACFSRQLTLCHAPTATRHPRDFSRESPQAARQALPFSCSSIAPC